MGNGRSRVRAAGILGHRRRRGIRGGTRGGLRGGTRGGLRGGTRGGLRGGTRGGLRGGTRGGLRNVGRCPAWLVSNLGHQKGHQEPIGEPSSNVQDVEERPQGNRCYPEEGSDCQSAATGKKARR